MVAFFQAVGEFLLIFTSSLVLGSTLGIATALVSIYIAFTNPVYRSLNHFLFDSVDQIHAHS